MNWIENIRRRAPRSGRFLLLPAVAALLPGPATAFGDDEINYEDHIAPIFREHCFNCHNGDDLRGDLDLTSFTAMMQGSSGGAVVEAGQADMSRLYLVTAHIEEPVMPPRGSPVPDDQLELIQKWINTGLRENADDEGIRVRRQTLELAVDADGSARPDGPPPMPETVLEQPVLATPRPNAVTAMAHSPWAPLLAVGAPQQVALYNTDTAELVGILPFPEGMPESLQFSRNGRYLLVGGGYGARLGLAALYDIADGRRVTTVGDEFDSVLASDITTDQSRVAMGGPNRVVRAFDTATGDEAYTIGKHTEWILALGYSPDGILLATGDRGGGLLVWEAHTGEEFYDLDGHRGAITAIAWRPDSNAFASASEDGSVRIWNMMNGQQLRSINAHGGGVTDVRYTHDGNLVTTGRDNRVKVWDGNGSELHAFGPTADLALQSVFNDDGTRVIVGDYAGNIRMYDLEDGEHVAGLTPNPPTLEQRIEHEHQAIAALHEEHPSFEDDLAAARSQVDEAQEAIDAAHRRREELEASVDALHGRDADLVEQLGELQQQIDDERLLTPVLARKARLLAGAIEQAEAARELADRLRARSAPAADGQDHVTDPDDAEAAVAPLRERADAAEAALAKHLAKVDRLNDEHFEQLARRQATYREEAELEGDIAQIDDVTLPELTEKLEQQREAAAPVEQIADQFAAHETQVARLEAAKVYTQIYYAKDELDELTEEHEVAELVLERAGQEHKQAEAALATARTEQEALKETVEASETMVAEAESDYQQAGSALDSARATLEQAEATLASSRRMVADAGEAVEAVANPKAEARAEREKLGRQLAEARNTLAALPGRVETARSEMQELAERTDTARAALEEHDEQLEAARESHEQAEAELAAAREQEEADDEAVAELEAKVNELAERVSALKHDRQPLAEELADARTAREGAAAELAGLGERKEALPGQITEMESRRETLAGRIAEYETKLPDLRKALAEANDAEKAAAEAMESARSAVAEKEERHKSLAETLATARDDLEELSGKLEQAPRRVADAEAKLAEAAEELAESRERKETAAEALAEFQAQFEQLQTQHAQLLP